MNFKFLKMYKILGFSFPHFLLFFMLCFGFSSAQILALPVDEQNILDKSKSGNQLNGNDNKVQVLTNNQALSVKVLTLNIWVNGKICTPQQVADLILSLDVDFVGLQECNSSFGNQVASLTNMYLASYDDCYLFSRTPYTKINQMFVKGINAWTNLNGQTVSVYNFHIRWDEEGDRNARTMVNTFALDPNLIQIAVGDFNDEHYSTQITIIEEHMRYCLMDLGWAPSQRVTWPAFGFYGGEGAQTIDLIFCNKKSKGRVVDGEIMNLSPILSDHKPVWAEIDFPADPNLIGPEISKIVPCFDNSTIEIWFDQDLDPESAQQISNYQIVPVDNGASVSVNDAAILKDPRRVRLLTSPHDFDKKYKLVLAGITDEFGIAINPGSEMEYIIRENLVKNSGAELGTENWDTSGGIEIVSDRENQYPYLGDYFFTGANLQDLSTASQSIDLVNWEQEIDAGLLAAEWNCYFATGYELLGDIQASRCEPYDEGEFYIEFVDQDDHVLMQATSKRWDTLYWHPYGETTNIPPGTRKAILYLKSYRKTANGLSNDAAFDQVFFSLKHLQGPHGFESNLLVNPSAETADTQGWNINGSIKAREHEEDKGRPVSGYYMFANDGISTARAFQRLDFSSYSDQIDAQSMAVRWGGYMRDYRGDSGGEISIEFLDQNNEKIDYATTGDQRIAEWSFYDNTTIIPVGTRSIDFILSLDAVADEGVYFDLLHIIPVSIATTGISDKVITNVDYNLYQNYPNPFNSQTVIKYALAKDSFVELIIYNILGKQVRTLVNNRQSGGYKSVVWDGKDSQGRLLPSGVYFYTLSTTDFTQTHKLLMIK